MERYDPIWEDSISVYSIIRIYSHTDIFCFSLNMVCRLEEFFEKYAIIKVEGEEFPVAVYRGFEEFVDGVELTGDDIDDIGIIPKS